MLRIRGCVCAFAAVLFLCSLPSARGQLIVAGYNMSGGQGATFNVDFAPIPGQWYVQASLVFNPTAPPMTKVFQSPITAAGGPILLDALQPLPILVDELYTIVGPPDGQSVSDWHERIVTPGWVWVTPGDPSFPDLFPVGTSLITRDGLPWPSEPLGGSDPTAVDVKFPPIDPPHFLDIHKALLWVGTETQQVWGDDPTETGIVVVEYPTPEPSSFVLATFGLLGLAAWRWRRRRR